MLPFTLRAVSAARAQARWASAGQRILIEASSISEDAAHGRDLDQLHRRFERLREMLQKATLTASGNGKEIKAAMAAATKSLAAAKKRQDKVGAREALSQTKNKHRTTAFEHFVKAQREQKGRKANPPTLKTLTDKWRRMTDEKKKPYFAMSSPQSEKASEKRDKEMSDKRPKEAMDEFKQFASRVMPVMYGKARAEGRGEEAAIEHAMRATRKRWAEEQKKKATGKK